MKRSFVWTLVLSAVWVVSGCGSTEGRERATIVIGEGNSLLHEKPGETKGLVYGPGDTVLVEWEDGTCYLNGAIYKPQPPQPPPVHPAEMLKGMYGAVPTVLEYVSTHEGDETEVWNEAVRRWEKQTRALMREQARQYMAVLESGKSADEAAEAALAVLLTSPLVSSAWVEDNADLAPTQCRNIRHRWAGEDRESLSMLSPHMTLDISPPKPMTRDDFKVFVRILRRLEGKGPVTLEIKGSNMFYMSGPGTEERIAKQRGEKQ